MSKQAGPKKVPAIGNRRLRLSVVSPECNTGGERVREGNLAEGSDHRAAKTERLLISRNSKRKI